MALVASTDYSACSSTANQLYPNTMPGQVPFSGWGLCQPAFPYPQNFFGFPNIATPDESNKLSNISEIPGDVYGLYQSQYQLPQQQQLAYQQLQASLPQQKFSMLQDCTYQPPTLPLYLPPTAYRHVSPPDFSQASAPASNTVSHITTNPNNIFHFGSNNLQQNQLSNCKQDTRNPTRISRKGQGSFPRVQPGPENATTNVGYLDESAILQWIKTVYSDFQSIIQECPGVILNDFVNVLDDTYGQILLNFFGLAENSIQDGGLYSSRNTPLGQCQIYYFRETTKLRYKCRVCHHDWTTIKGNAKFYIIQCIDIHSEHTCFAQDGVTKHISLKPGFNVAFQLTRQLCGKEHPNGQPQYEEAQCYLDEIGRIFLNILVRMIDGPLVHYRPHYKTYTRNSKTREGKPQRAHEYSKCEDCRRGVCQSSRSSLQQ